MHARAVVRRAASSGPEAEEEEELKGLQQQQQWTRCMVCAHQNPLLCLAENLLAKKLLAAATC